MTKREAKYARHPLEAQDIASGRAAFARGLARHYNAFDFHADPQRYCAWDEGWKAAARADQWAPAPASTAA